MVLDFKEEICNYLANVEDYSNLSEKEIDEVAENVCEMVANDDQLAREITSTIEWYVNKYLASKGDENNEF